MLGHYVDTESGYEITAFSTLYVDYGLKIDRIGGGTVFYSPCALSVDSYGHHWTNDEGEELEESIPWSEDEWNECLKEESWELLDAFLPEESNG